MASLRDRLRRLFKQKGKQQQQQPTKQPPAPAQTATRQPEAIPQQDGPVDTQNKTATTTGTLTIKLQNQTTSSNVFAYISMDFIGS